jgi:hypothetical protein
MENSLDSLFTTLSSPGSSGSRRALRKQQDDGYDDVRNVEMQKVHWRPSGTSSTPIYAMLCLWALRTPATHQRPIEPEGEEGTQAV